MPRKVRTLLNSPILVALFLLVGSYLIICGGELPPSVFDWWIIGVLMLLYCVLTGVIWFLYALRAR